MAGWSVLVEYRFGTFYVVGHPALRLWDGVPPNRPRQPAGGVPGVIGVPTLRFVCTQLSTIGRSLRDKMEGEIFFKIFLTIRFLPVTNAALK
jgi:hypothetical protein